MFLESREAKILEINVDEIRKKLLGAGLVAGPLVRYLLNLPDVKITVASRTVGKAEKLIGGHPDGTAAAFDIAFYGVPAGGQKAYGCIEISFSAGYAK